MYKWLLSFFIGLNFLSASAQQVQDSLLRDSLQMDTAVLVPIAQPFDYNALLKNNVYLEYKKESIAQQERGHSSIGNELLFYIILGLTLFFSLLRYAFPKFFSTLFKVFINTSVKQSQLTDQLQNNSLPAVLFNVLFTTTTGIFLYQFLSHQNMLPEGAGKAKYLVIFILCISVIYSFKAIILKAAGWLTGNKSVSNSYNFIVFLVNKILGIFLLPLIVFIAFAPVTWQYGFLIIALIIIVLSFIIRYIKAFGLLGKKLQWNAMHAIIFIVAIEALPVLILFKAVKSYLQGNYYF